MSTVVLETADEARPEPVVSLFPVRRVARAVGVHGWDHLDPVLVAALALEAPVLLVGEHGTAKSLIVERLAACLGLSFRHYNAALLNYDDLVGIPLPDEHGGLRFVGTAGAVWDAEFVFFDEVNRCRVDLQNKLFPIVHERRVAGVDLPVLRHRWAAMNPPCSDTDPLAGYLGTEALDAALADRFWFVVRVPGWAELSRADREALAAGVGPQPAGDGVDAAEVVTRVRDELVVAEAELGEALVPYVVGVTDLLRQAGIVLSPRRVRVLVRAIVAVHTAGRVLGRTTSVCDAAELVLRNGLPQWADPVVPNVVQVVAAHVQTWELTVAQADWRRRALLEEVDPVERIRLALDTAADEATLARLVTSALAEQPTDAHRVALAVVLTRALADRPLTPAAWAPLAELAEPVLRPATYDADGAGWVHASLDGVYARVRDDTRRSGIALLERALVMGCGPGLLHGVDVEELLATFRRHLRRFEVRG